MEKTVHAAAGRRARADRHDGESRELKRSAGGLVLTFAFALLIVYCSAGAQFESFVHPLVILAAVPMALTSALFGLWLFELSSTSFSQIGAVMLIGIASKNGILDRGVRQPAARPRHRSSSRPPSRLPLRACVPC